MHRHVLVLFVCTLALGCAPTPTGSRSDSGPGGGSEPDDGGGRPMTMRDAGRPSFDECARQITMAETRARPVDIVWVIDNSGSMDGEARIVQDNMNAFAAAVGASGIDYHVVVMTTMGFVNVPPPLGTDAMRFFFANVNVQSHDGLIALVENFGTYSGFLRPDAVTHFVVVTDDESERMTWTDFRTQMEMLLGHGFTVHAIASPPGSTHCVPSSSWCVFNEEGCSGPNGDAADNGEQYWALAMATGGQQHSICTADWSGLFASLTSAIAVPTPLPCRYALPPPPDGMTFNPGLVNVVYTPSASTSEVVVPKVEDYAACGPSGGWYYEGDDIVVCPATCDVLRADPEGRVDIVLGCDTLLI